MKERMRLERPPQPHVPPLGRSDIPSAQPSAPISVGGTPDLGAGRETSSVDPTGSSGHDLAHLDIFPGRAAGQPLPANLAGRFATSLGTDFADVRVHMDPR